jgi:DNA-binding CsgD family transcriptional regulator
VFCTIDDDPWLLSLWRGPRAGAFRAASAARLRAAAPELQRVARLAAGLSRVQDLHQLDTLEALGIAAIAVNRRGVVLRPNAAAERLLGPELKLSHGRLSADRDSDAALQRLLAAAAHPPTGAAAPDAVRIDRGQRAPLLVQVLPLVQRPAPIALLMITDLAAHPKPPERLLRTHFGLSAAEARLAVHLTTGQELPALARDLGVAHETARNQLKAVFAKTGVHHQAGLVALLTRLGAAAARGND